MEDKNYLGQIKYDIYEKLLKDMDKVILYINKATNNMENKEPGLSFKGLIIRHLRSFIKEEMMQFDWEDICVIIDETILLDSSNPLRIYGNIFLYIDDETECH